MNMKIKNVYLCAALTNYYGEVDCIITVYEDDTYSFQNFDDSGFKWDHERYVSSPVSTSYAYKGYHEVIPIF